MTHHNPFGNIDFLTPLVLSVNRAPIFMVRQSLKDFIDDQAMPSDDIFRLILGIMTADQNLISFRFRA